MLKGDEVAKRLAHLLSVDGNHIVVEPVGHHLVALTGHRLSYLALVMWEHQVHASSVDVEMGSQVFASHRCAFAMPTRESIAPRRWPTHDVLWLCRLPKGEVGLVLLLTHTSEVTAGIFHILKTYA